MRANHPRGESDLCPFGHVSRAMARLHRAPACRAKSTYCRFLGVGPLQAAVLQLLLRVLTRQLFFLVAAMRCVGALCQCASTVVRPQVIA
jgi:hypothetical protein